MATCNGCKTQKEPESVPYMVHEGDMARMERSNKRLWIVIILLILLLVGSNLCWIYYESSFEDVVITQENADGYNNYIGNDGDIVNGETDGFLSVSVKQAVIPDTLGVMFATEQADKKHLSAKRKRGDMLGKINHEIPETAKNSDVHYLLNEFVRVDRDRMILEDHWFGGLSFYQISEKYNISLTAVKKIVYGIGDKILLKLN